MTSRHTFFFCLWWRKEISTISDDIYRDCPPPSLTAYTALDCIYRPRWYIYTKTFYRLWGHIHKLSNISEDIIIDTFCLFWGLYRYFPPSLTLSAVSDDIYTKTTIFEDICRDVQPSLRTYTDTFYHLLGHIQRLFTNSDDTQRLSATYNDIYRNFLPGAVNVHWDFLPSVMVYTKTFHLWWRIQTLSTICHGIYIYIHKDFPSLMTYTDTLYHLWWHIQSFYRLWWHTDFLPYMLSRSQEVGGGRNHT